MGRALILLAGSAAVLAIAGCGSTKTTPKAVVAPPTKAQYIARADAICHEHELKLDTLTAEVKRLEDTGDPGISAELALSTEAKDSEETDAQLGALPPPATGASTIVEWLHWRDLATTDGGNATAALDAENEKASLADSSAGDRASTKAADIAKSYGLTVCARW